MKKFSKMFYIIFIWISTSLILQHSFAQDIGGSCNNTVFCRPQYSQCQSGVCRCNPGFQKSVLGNDLCLPEANRLDDSCTQEIQCKPLGDQVRCYYGSCKCRENYTPDSTNTRCVRIAYLNDQCNINGIQCSGTNVICGQGNICVCSPGYVPDMNSNALCVMGARLVNDICTDSRYCSTLGDASCVIGKCECNNGYGPIINRTRCIRAAKLNDYCNITDECAAGLQPGYQSRVTCDFNRCICKEPFIASDDRTRCNEPRKLNEQCTETSECSQNDTVKAVCNNSTCLCEDGYFPGADDTCIMIAGISEECDDSDIFCGTENVVCENGLCVCDKGYQISAENTSCVKEVHKLYENCTENIQCSALLGDYSVCMNGSCVCQSGHTAGENNTTCIKIIMQKKVNCSENSDCFTSMGNHSVCVNDACTCGSGYNLNENKTVCVKIPKPDTPEPGDVNLTCATNSDCSITFSNYSECKNNACVCQSGYGLIKSRQDCIKISKLGDTCSKVEECHLGIDKNHTSRVECTKNKCTCKKGFASSTDHTKCNGAEKITGVSILLLISTFFFTKVLL